MKSKIILLVFISCALFSVGCKRHAVTAKPAVPEPSTQAATATSTTPTPVALPPGLVFYYNFDTEPVNGKISDKSGSGNDGQAVGVQWVADGHLGGSAAFGITNSYITVPNNDSLNPPRMTLAAWIKTSVRDEIWRRIFDKNFKTDFAISIGGGFVPNRDFHGKAIWEVNTISNRAASGTLGSVVPVNDGQWHHVIAEADRRATTFTLYIDGQQDATGPGLGTNTSLANDANLHVGGTPQGHNLEGAIDFLRIARGTLADSKTTIAELYAWEFDGPFLYDFTSHKRPTDGGAAGAIDTATLEQARENSLSTLEERTNLVGHEPPLRTRVWPDSE